jgi:hypothetical protein
MNPARVIFFARLVSAPQLAILSCLTLVAGASSTLIAIYGAPTPIYDQWDLEAAGLYKPYLEGHLAISSLFAPHNEHRMFFTRAVALALFELRGAWDPVWEMVADIVFRSLAIWLMLVFFNRLLGVSGAVVLALFCALVSAVPFTWETILMGYPSSFYFLLIFSFGAFLLLNGGVAWSTRWWIGTLLGALAYFNVASGMFTLLPADSIVCLQMILGVRRGTQEWAGVGFHLTLIALMFLATPTIEGHALLKAQSVAQFAQAFATIAAWPFTWRFWPLLYGPAILFSARLVVSRPAFADDRWSYLMLLAWLVFQIAALAYGRGAIASRYIDILAVGVVLNFAIILYLCQRVAQRGALFAYALAGSWLVPVLIAGSIYATSDVSNALNYHSSWLRTKTKNVKSFIDTDDASLLAGKTYPDIPYPDATRLIQLLSDPVIRAILPPNLADDGSTQQFVGARTYLRGALSKTTVKLRDWIVRHGNALFAVGFASLILAMMRCQDDRNAPRGVVGTSARKEGGVI